MPFFFSPLTSKMHSIQTFFRFYLCTQGHMISHPVCCYGTTMSSCPGYCKSFLLGLLTSNLITFQFNISVAANLLLNGRSEDTSSVLKALQWAPLPLNLIFGTLLGLLLSRYLVHLCFVPWDFCTGFSLCLEWSLLRPTEMMPFHLFLVFTNNLRDAFSDKSK